MMNSVKTAIDVQDCTLDVDLGSQLIPGHAMAIEFRLKAARALGTPRVTCALSQMLDQTNWIREPALRSTGTYSWEFRQNTYLREKGAVACVAGPYHIDIVIEWHSSSSATAPRRMHAKLTLVVQAPSAPREVVIESEGASIIDLDRFRLDDFSRVVVRSKDSSILSATSPLLAPIADKSPERYFRLRLHEDVVACDRLKLETITPSKRQWLLFASPELRLGRTWHADTSESLKNHVVLTPSPCVGENRRLWERISSNHLRLELGPDGVRIHDCDSRNGTTVDGRRIPAKGWEMLRSQHENGRELEVASALKLRLTPLVDKDPALPSLEESVSRSGNGDISSAIWELAERARLEAVRLQRIENLVEEEYIMLFRQVALGSIAGRGPTLQLPTPVGSLPPVRIFHADDLFWLERISNEVPVRLHQSGRISQRRSSSDGSLEQATPQETAEEVPLQKPVILRAGQLLEIGENQLRVRPCEQVLH